MLSFRLKKQTGKIEADTTFKRSISIISHLTCLKTDKGKLKKQPFADAIQKGCPYEFRKFHRKTPVLEILFNKVTSLRSATLLKGDSNTDIFL